VGTSQRLASLRRDYLTRDRSRCVISRTFDDSEAIRRVARDGDEEARDEDGNLLKNESGTFAPLEVAHIVVIGPRFGYDTHVRRIRNVCEMQADTICIHMYEAGPPVS
jgi:hypothetical protein